MIQTEVLGMSANSAMEIVVELKLQGYNQGVDFDFAYCPERWDGMTGEVIKKRTQFLFYNHSVATWFAIKYG